jgi:hypothetical protein
VITFIFTPIARLVAGVIFPATPTNLAALQEGTGDTHISWTDGHGRTLSSGVSYSVQILSLADGSVLRTIAAPTTNCLYTNAMAVADFGSTPTYLSFKVTQTTPGGTSAPASYSSNISTIAAPTGATVVQDSQLGMKLTWTSSPGVTYVVYCYNIVNGNLSRTATISDGSGTWTMTAAMQTTDYGSTSVNYSFGVSSVQAGTGYLSQKELVSGSVSSWFTDASNLKAVYQGNNDIIYTWSGDNTKQWQLKNSDVTNSSVISTTNLPVGTMTWTWTAAAQTAQYGFTSHNVNWSVAMYDATLGGVGDAVTYNGAATAS